MLVHCDKRYQRFYSIFLKGFWTKVGQCYATLQGNPHLCIICTTSYTLVFPGSQVADETGEVQYATQTVTVTERDAKALGQPVGSTTTVLLTAYPGGHSGAVGGEASTVTQPASDQLLVTQQNSSSTNIQVVYSASTMESISDSIGTSIPSSIPQTESETFTATFATSAVAAEVTDVSTSMGGMLSTATTKVSEVTPPISDVVATEYLNSTTATTNASVGEEMILGGTENGSENVNVGGSGNEGDTATDLAAELINQYASSGNSDIVQFDMKVATSKPDENRSPESILPATTTPQIMPNTTEN